MICGTSTGGIIALGIATKKPISEIIKIYENNANEMFPGHNSHYITQPFISLYYKFFQLCGYKYTNTSIYNISNIHFGNKTLNDVDNLLCIPAYCINDGKQVVFKYPHTEGPYYKDKDVLLKDVIMATTAAPTYFPVHQITNTKYRDGYYTDGGIWANNPTLIGIVEATLFFVGKQNKYSKCDILSIGNIHNDKYIEKINTNTFWNIFNPSRFYSTILNANNEGLMDLPRLLCNSLSYKYTRIQNNNHLSLNNIKNIEMDNSNKKYIDKLYMNAMDDIDKYFNLNNTYNIERFFKNKKSYII
jgi:patatin-like phospholipase/acyl hydrolase